jgi:hypothetical protein
MELFDLKKFDIDHSIKLQILNTYTDNQTCSKAYFDLVKHIFEKSTYISCDDFIEKYDERIDELITNYSDKNLIVCIPTDIPTKTEILTKSNFYFTLYFLYRYRENKGEPIEYVHGYRWNIRNKPITVDIENPLFIICDDFVYSGTQISNTIVYCFSKITTLSPIEIYLCIIGKTLHSQKKFEKFRVGRFNYNVIIPQNLLEQSVQPVTLRDVLIDKIHEDNHIEKSIINDDVIYDFVAQNNMYILEVVDNEIFAIEQFFKTHAVGDSEIDRLNITLTYLFFKYPDYISTINSMCVLDDNNNKNKYAIHPYKILKKEPHDELYKQNLTYKITEEILRCTTEEMNTLKRAIKNGRIIDITKYNGIEECNYKEELYDDMRHVNIGQKRMIDLMECQENFEDEDSGLCNNCIQPFYKTEGYKAIVAPLSQDLIQLVEDFNKMQGGKKRRKTHKRKRKQKGKNTKKN